MGTLVNGVCVSNAPFTEDDSTVVKTKPPYDFNNVEGAILVGARMVRSIDCVVGR